MYGGEGEGVYDVLTLQKSRGGARAHIGGAKAPPCPKCNPATYSRPTLTNMIIT